MSAWGRVTANVGKHLATVADTADAAVRPSSVKHLEQLAIDELQEGIAVDPPLQITDPVPVATEVGHVLLVLHEVGVVVPLGLDLAEDDVAHAHLLLEPNRTGR